MGLPVPFPGRPLEGHGNVPPREMAVQPVSRKRPVNRTRRISRPARTERRFSGARRAPASYFAASEAAPRSPALLRCIAGTIGVFSSSSGRNSPWNFETPPPTTNRSGEKMNSTCA